ncbi:MAG: HAMP domain-containing histidine kinase [Lachnospiraceae bacterium]|nr:HAMP domain-containing histidine kinase [Lachnospiraceae bacterium]
MNLKIKLMVTFVTLLSVPILLIWLCLSILQKNQMESLRELYRSENVWEMWVGNTLQVLDAVTDGVQDEIRQILEDNPDRLLDEDTQRDLESDLEEVGGYLAILKNGELVFNGFSAKDEEMLTRELRDVGEAVDFTDGGIYLAGEIRCYTKQQVFRYQDLQSGRVCLLMPIGEILPQARKIVVEMAIAVLTMLILIAFTLTMWIYYTMLRPIKELKKATQAIRDGNLEYELDLDETDEIGELGRDFEAMRLRLKEQAEEKLEYDRQSKELISNISHDLKTPITAIKGYVEGILDGVASSPEKLDRYLRTIYNKTCDMQKLIEELTFYSKIDTNHIPYSFQKINLADYLNDCVSEVSDELEAANIEFRYRNRVDDDTLIIADAEQMRRVFNNIISNSVKYMDKKNPFIHLDVLDSGDFVEIRIEDNGRGIGSRELPNIFERFYRTDASRNSSTGGSGIGLSIVRKIIEDHGGKVWATSVEGEGTTIHFVLRKYKEEGRT